MASPGGGAEAGAGAAVADAGTEERLLARLKPALDDYRAALEVVNDFRDRPAGLLRLTVAPPAIDRDMMATLARFLAAYPEISLEISSDSGLTDIVAGRFERGQQRGGGNFVNAGERDRYLADGLEEI